MIPDAASTVRMQTARLVNLELCESESLLNGNTLKRNGLLYYYYYIDYSNEPTDKIATIVA